MERSSRLILATILLSTVLTVAGFVFSPGGYLSPLASPPLLGATGGIIGSISIGPISPTCISGPLPSYYNQIQVRVTPSSDPPLTIPVRWLLVGGCWAATNFEIGLDPGAYSLTLTSC